MGDEAAREMGAEMTGGMGETEGAGTAGGTATGPEITGEAPAGPLPDVGGAGGEAPTGAGGGGTEVGADPTAGAGIAGPGADESGYASGGLDPDADSAA